MSESNNSAWNNILTVLFIILFLVALVIIVDKTDAIERIRSEYTDNVPEDAKDTLDNIFSKEPLEILNEEVPAISLEKRF